MYLIYQINTGIYSFIICYQTPEKDASIQSISIDPMGTMMSAINNKVRELMHDYKYIIALNFYSFLIVWIYMYNICAFLILNFNISLE